MLSKRMFSMVPVLIMLLSCRLLPARDSVELLNEAATQEEASSDGVVSSPDSSPVMVRQNGLLTLLLSSFMENPTVDNFQRIQEQKRKEKKHLDEMQAHCDRYYRAGAEKYYDRLHAARDAGQYFGAPGDLPDIETVGSLPTRQTAVGEVLDVPAYSRFDMDTDVSDGRYCGPVSCRMVLDAYHLSGDINDIADNVLTGNGASQAGMLDCLRKAGLNGSSLEYGKNMSWLKRVTREAPVIASLRGEYSPGKYTMGHTVVVIGVTDSMDVIINDPANGSGEPVVVPGQMFARSWRGRAAIVAKH